MPQKPQVIPKKRPPGFALLLFLAAVALILLLVILVRLPQQRSQTSYKEEVSAARLNKRRTFTYDETRDLALVGNRLVKLRTDQLYVYGLEGEEIARETLNYRELGFAKRQKECVVGDRRTVGQAVFFFNENGLLWQNGLEGSFAKAEIGQKHLALIDEVNAGFPLVHLMQKTDGQLLYRLSFAESGHPVDLAFTPNESALDVLLLNTRASRSKVIVKRYDLEGGQMAQRIPEGLEDFFYGLEHQGNQLVLFAPTRIVSLDYQEDQLLYDLKFAEVKWVQGGLKTSLALVRNDEGGPLRLISIAKDGGIEALYETTDDVRCILEEKDFTAFAIGDDLLLFDRGKERLKSEIKLPDEVLSMGYDGHNSLYLLTATAVYELALN